MRRLVSVCCVLGVLGLLVPVAGCGSSSEGKNVDPVVQQQPDKPMPERKPVKRDGASKAGERPPPKIDAN
jgi:hypothetical protein